MQVLCSLCENFKSLDITNFPSQLSSCLLATFLINVRIDFVVFSFAAILFNFYIAFRRPIPPSNVPPQVVLTFVFAGILDSWSSLLDLIRYHKQQRYYAQDFLSFRL